MKKIILLTLFVVSAMGIFAQSWNPFVSQGIVSPAPLTPVEFDGTGELSVKVGNTGVSDLLLVGGDETKLEIVLSNGIPNNIDPINALGGDALFLFDWSYDQPSNTYTATQNQTIPGNYLGFLTIQYEVTENTSRTVIDNGFSVELTPPAYSSGSNAIDDDFVSSFTYVSGADFGDAPMSYGEAIHEIDIFQTNGMYERYIYLGSSVDAEDNAIFSVDGLGDDNDGLIDDENGVTIPTLDPGTTVNIPVEVTIEDAGFGVLSGWIDWNADGMFDPVNELVTAANTFVLATQTVNVSVIVPANAVTGNTFARFRIGDFTSSSPSGSSSYGEVEDYLVTISGETCETPDIIVGGTTCASDGSATYDVTFTAPAGATVMSDAGTVNVGSITGIPIGTNVTITAELPSCDVSMVTVPSATCAYDLSLDKNVTSAGPYAQGSTVTYEVVISNDGVINANNIQFMDVAQAGLNLLSSDVASNANVIEVSQMLYEISSLGFGETETIEFTYMIDANFQGTSLENKAQITQDDGDDIDSDPDTGDDVDEDGDMDGDDDDEDAAVITIDQNYDLSLEKNVISNGPFVQGSTVTFEITLTNEGSLDAANIEFIDTPPVGLNYVSSNSISLMNVGEPQNGSFIVTNLPSGSTQSVEVTYQIDNLFQGTSLVNIAMITADNGDDIDSDPDTGVDVDEDGDLDGDDDDEDAAVITIGQNYDLSLEKNVLSNGPFVQGSTVTFEITLTNEGSLDAANIEFIDTPPVGLNYVSSNSISLMNVGEPQNGSFIVTNLPSGSTQSVEVTYQIDNLFQGTSLVNIAMITADNGDDIDSDPDTGVDVDEDGDLDGDDDDDDDDETIEVIQAYDLSIQKIVTSSGPYSPNSQIDYQVIVTNEGSLDANNIQFTDIPESGLNYISSDANSNGNINKLSGLLFEVINLPAGSSEVLNLSFRIDNSYQSFSITNDVFITLDNGDDVDSDPDTGDDIDEDGDLDGDDDDEDKITVAVELDVFSSIGNFVWEDLDGDGLQGGNERGLSDIRVELYNSNGFLVDAQITNANGNYLFDRIIPGDYFLKFINNDGLESTITIAGNDLFDSNADNKNGSGTTGIIRLEAGENNLTVDAGFYKCILIGDNVWFDYNEDDLFDATENGINGMLVQLFRNENGSWILADEQYTGHKPNTPSDDGYFKFCTRPGRYYLKFVNPPETLVPARSNRGNNEEVDSDVTNRFGIGTTNDFTVLSGDEKCDIGAGYYKMGSIGDFVWMDDNGNGMRESNEEGVSDVVVRAMNLEGDVVASTVSDEMGHYVLDYLGKDSYFIHFEVPSELYPTSANIGVDDSIDSDIDNSYGEFTTKLYQVSPGAHIPNVDAGLMFGILPVEWLDVWGENRTSHNYIEWNIGTESNVSHYEIERSLNGLSDFEMIGKVLAEGNAVTTLTYNFEDYSNAEAGEYYYRIKQFDLNGEFDYSEIVVIDQRDANARELSAMIYPNPVVDVLTVEIDVPISVTNLNANIYDTTGKLVWQNVIVDNQLEVGLKRYSVDIANLASGVYTLKLNLDNDIIFIKLIVAGK